jgi:pectate lyase
MSVISSTSDRSSARSPRRARIALLLISSGLFTMAAQALPVIPGAEGFGVDTVAGRGGTVHRITNLNASGAGSLKACVDASGPRVCVFEVSGVIKQGGDLAITKPFITIAGQTAPSPGITLRGGALRISASNVLVQHIAVRAGDDREGHPIDNRDSLKIEASTDQPISNIVVDHCSFTWAIDETAALWNGWDNVTLSNNIFAEGLRQSLDGKEAGYGIIVGPWKGKVSLIGNLLAHQVERNPLSRGGQMVFVNNVVYNRAHMDVDLQSQDAVATNNSIVGNVFVRGPDYTRSYNKPVLLRTSGTLRVSTQAKVYVHDNASLETLDDNVWSVVSASDGDVPNSVKVSTAPAWPKGLTAKSTKGNAVLNSVLSSAGARPADRDVVDKRIVDSVRNRTGKIINCVAPNGTTRCDKNAGGWPTLAQNKRTLSLPSNPAAVTSSGYTNLELWLQKMAAELEGKSVKRPIAPVLASRD